MNARNDSSEKEPDVRFVSVESGISALGFRKIAAIARQMNPGTRIYFITVNNLYSLRSHLFPSLESDFQDTDIEIIAKELSDADLVCFSSMTASAEYVEKIAKSIKKISPNAFIIWGGVHCIVYPEDAIKNVDAIFTGEGEVPFTEFYSKFKEGKDYINTPGVWFNRGGIVQKNRNPPLNTPEMLNQYPYPFIELSCEIYDQKKKCFRKFKRTDYTQFNGLTYRTVWSLGCPYKCIYCANDSFISLDQDYCRIRYPSVDYIISEIENAIRLHPYIKTVAFYDDNFIAIPAQAIREFAEEYKKRIDLPFVVFGIHPNTISEEKIELLAKAGLNRTRMGIQSGSRRTLDFYHRFTHLERIAKSASILAKASKRYRMIPPAYDIISDNPVETRDELVETIEFLYGLDRPYTLTIFSLRVFPKTRLWDYFREHPEIDIRYNTSSYLETKKTMANIMLYMLAIAKPPRWLFDSMLKGVRGPLEKQREHPVLYFLVKSVYLASRAFDHLIRMDFTVIVGWWTYYLWKLSAHFF